MDAFDVTIVDAVLGSSVATGAPVVKLEFLPHRAFFLDGKLVPKFFCRISNDSPVAGLRRATLRRVLGVVGSIEPFTDKELGSVVGRRLRVGVESIEYQGVLRIRVADFLLYVGGKENLDYSDNEYVFMIRELERGGR